MCKIIEEITFLKDQVNMYRYDKLTGLKGRHDLDLMLHVLKDKPYNVSMYDVIGLKHINDTNGYDAGDDLLISVTNVLKNMFSENTECFRIGGDEFIVIEYGDINSNDELCLIDNMCGYIYYKSVDDDSTIRDIIRMSHYFIKKNKL